jgi:hypothetical protein
VAKRLLLILAALLLSGCVPRGVTVTPLPTLPAAKVARALLAPLEEVRTLQGTGILKVTQNDLSQVTDIYFMLDRDQGIRLDVVTMFGTPLVTVVARADAVVLLDFRRKMMVTGPAKARTLFYMMHFEIDPELLRQVAAGGVRRDEPKWRATAPPADAEAWWYFKSADWTTGLDPETLRPRWLSITGEDPVAVSWSDLAEVDGVQVTQTIGIERPTKNQHLLLKLHELQANHPIENAVFHPKLPEGWRTSHIGGLE